MLAQVMSRFIAPSKKHLNHISRTMPYSQTVQLEQKSSCKTIIQLAFL